MLDRNSSRLRASATGKRSTAPSFVSRLFVSSLLHKPAPKNRRVKLNTQPNITKHHYVLGSLAIVVGIWITHTTTATVYDGVAMDEATFNRLNTQLLGSPTMLDNSMGDNFYGTDNIEQLGFLATATKQSPTDQIIQALEVELDETVYTVKRGDTFAGIAKKLALDIRLPYEITRHDTAKQLASLAVDKELVFKKDDAQELKQINYPVSDLQELVVDLEDGAVVDAQIKDLPYETKQNSFSGVISSSLYEAAMDVGMNNTTVMELARIFGWDIDFVLDIQNGDSFHVIVEEHLLEGEKLSDGDIIAAEFTTQGHTFRAIRFEDSDGNANYYTPQGESMLGTFLRSPVEYSRISSRFGKRKHPILKTWRAHKGVDYAASRGTPIRATADGKVTYLGRKGGYGKTIELRHAGTYSTLYAHMNSYGKGLRKGDRVRQGQVIGYIGSTGLATGPHLHYEFRLAGVHRDPLKQKNTKAGSISKNVRAEFEQHARAYITKLDGIAGRYQLALNNQNSVSAK